MMPGLERYEIVRPLGEGGEANVYLVRDPTTKGLVALRVLKEQHEALGPMFLQRARTVAVLGHPGIVRVLETSREGELPIYVALSYAPNGTLGEKVRDGALTELGEIIELVAQVAEACHFAHQHGLLHGDISPQNVLFDEGQCPILTDFGGGPVPGDVTGVHPDFSAPEKAAGGGDTIAADVYSLGAVLAFLLDRCGSTTYRHRRARRVAAVALSAAAGRRHPSAQEFAQELRRVLAHEPLKRPAPGPAERGRLWFERTRPTWLRATLALSCLIALEGGLIGLAGYREAEQAKDTLRAYRELATEYADHARVHLEALTAGAWAGASDPAIVELLRDPTAERPLASLARLYDQSQIRGASSVALFDWEGTLLVRYPGSQAVDRRDFSFRDYYAGLKALVTSGAQARRPEELTYISRAYRGEASCGAEFSVTVPILTPERGPVGFLLISIHAQHTLKQIGVARLDHQKGVHLQSALFAERSADRPGRASCGGTIAPVGRFVALIHPDLFRAEEYPLDIELSRQLDALTYRGDPAPQLDAWERDPLVLERFRDPVTQIEQMGAFAPVGRTQLAVGVFAERSRFEAWSGIARSTWVWTLASNLVFLVAGLWAAASGRRTP